MEILNTLLTIVYVFCCLFLGFVVLIQKGEGGGLGGAFGGGAVDVAFGAKADMTWKRATAVCAALFMSLAIVLGILSTQMQKTSIAVREAQAEQKKAADEAEAKGGGGTGKLEKTDTNANPGVKTDAQTPPPEKKTGN